MQGLLACVSLNIQVLQASYVVVRLDPVRLKPCECLRKHWAKVILGWQTDAE